MSRIDPNAKAPQSFNCEVKEDVNEISSPLPNDKTIG